MAIFQSFARNEGLCLKEAVREWAVVRGEMKAEGITAL